MGKWLRLFGSPNWVNFSIRSTNIGANTKLQSKIVDRRDKADKEDKGNKEDKEDKGKESITYERNSV